MGGPTFVAGPVMAQTRPVEEDTGAEAAGFLGGGGGNVNININVPASASGQTGGENANQNRKDDSPEEVDEAISANTNSIHQTVADAKKTSISIVTDPLPPGLKVLTSMDQKDESEENDEHNGSNSKNVTLEN